MVNPTDGRLPFCCAFFLGPENPPPWPEWVLSEQVTEKVITESAINGASDKFKVFQCACEQVCACVCVTVKERARNPITSTSVIIVFVAAVVNTISCPSSAVAAALSVTWVLWYQTPACVSPSTCSTEKTNGHDSKAQKQPFISRHKHSTFYYFRTLNGMKKFQPRPVKNTLRRAIL